MDGRPLLLTAILLMPATGFARVIPIHFRPAGAPAPAPTTLQRFGSSTDIIQDYFADEQERAGFGRETFELRRGVNGKPVVETFQGEHDAAYYGLNKAGTPAYNSYKTFAAIVDEITTKRPARGDVLLIVCDGCPWLGRKGVAVAGDYLDTDFGINRGEQSAIFCDHSHPNEPETRGSVYEDSPRSLLASSRFGGVAHELGHAFGAHDGDDLSLMGGGGHHDFAGALVGAECIAAIAPQVNATDAQTFHDSGHFFPGVDGGAARAQFVVDMAGQLGAPSRGPACARGR